MTEAMDGLFVGRIDHIRRIANIGISMGTAKTGNPKK